MSLLKRIHEKIGEIGVARLPCCVIQRAYLYWLRKRFPFDRWHAMAPACCVPYKQRVANLVSSLALKGVIDVGCGLGDIGRILCRKTNLSYLGLDIDMHVINAARHLSGSCRRLQFEVGGLSKVPEFAKEKRYDVLLTLNWVHEISSETYVQLVNAALWPEVRYLLVDVINPHKVSANCGYKHFHNADDLLAAGLAFRLKGVHENIGKGRDMLIFER